MRESFKDSYSVNEPRFKSTLRQLTNLISESYEEILKLNTVLSKSESNEVFGMLKIGQIIKENLIESDGLINNLGKNIEN